MVFLVLLRHRVAIDSLWVGVRRQPAADADVMERLRRIITTLIWFIISLLIALFIPDIGVVISLLGGLAAIFIFVFPGQLSCCIWSQQQHSMQCFSFIFGENIICFNRRLILLVRFVVLIFTVCVVYCIRSSHGLGLKTRL